MFFEIVYNYKKVIHKRLTGTVCSQGSCRRVIIDSDCPITSYVIRHHTGQADCVGKEGNNTFNSNNYWSATENNANNAWRVNFNNGNTNTNNKTNNNYVRCVR